MAKDNTIFVGLSAKVGGLKHHPLLFGRDYSFNKKKDLKRVEPSSIMLLSEVLASGVVPPDAKELEFNDISDPNKIAGRVTNVFDAIDLSRDIAKSSINKPGSDLSPTPSPDPSPTPSPDPTPSPSNGE